MREFCRARWILFAAVAVVLAIWFALDFHDTTLDDPLDHVLVVLIAATFTLAPLVQLRWTVNWSSRAVGVFLSSVGLAVLFIAAVWVRLFADQPANVCNIRRIAAGYQGLPCDAPVTSPEWATDLARACLIVGGLLFLTGLLRWAKYKMTEGEERPAHQKSWPFVERRNGSPGRRSVDLERAGEA